MIKLISILTEDLRAWFGKGGKGGVGGGGWDRYNSSGDRVGKCGDADKGDAYSACLSKDKAAKLGKDGRAAFVKRKRAAQKKGGDAKKGGEQSKGQKTIKVKTGVNEADPQTGSGKKPKGSSRRLYTDENPSDTVSIRFKTKEDIADTLGKGSFTSKSHKRQSQIINLIHQRVRAAYQNAKDPDVKSRLKRGLDYIETRKEASKKKTQQYQKKGKTNIGEAIIGDKIACNKCEHSWPIATGGDKPYLCHNCYHDNTPLAERLLTLLEKNTPTDPTKWAYYKSQAKKKFDVYPSAYANGWAAKKYKAAGGGWKRGK